MEREEWLAERRKGLGSSDAPAIMGMSPWSSRLSVYASKKGLSPDKGESELMYWGHALEEPIAKRFSEVTGWEVVNLGETTIQRHKDHPYLTATLDRVVKHPEKGDVILEIKTTGIAKEDDWEDGVPDHYFIQVQHQLMVTGMQHAIVAVLIGGQKMRWYDVPRDEGVVKLLLDEMKQFWEEHVLADNPPPADGKPGTSEALAGMFPKDDGTVAPLEDYAAVDALERLMAAKEQIKNWEEEVARCENTLKLMMGGSTRGVLPNGWSLEWKTVQRKPYTVQGSESRTFRVVKPKKGRQ